jgi:hypothetical protein
MSFAGCGKLKNIVGLSQPEAPTPPKVDSQPDTSTSSEADNQIDTSASSEVNSQPEAPAPPEVNSQPKASAPPKAKEVADKKWVYVSGLTILAVVIGASYIFAPPPPPRT